MSVNITVNGKFVSNHCQKNPLLLDREKAKKELEEERRKKRLLQVREQSKKIAEKIRNDVKESKRKGLEKYESTKAEEFETWRQQALQQNTKECCEAIFQVGTAHRAAKMENKAQAHKLATKQGTYKEFRKQMAARRKNIENMSTQGPCICNKVHVCPSTQFECKCYQAGKDADESQKRKRDTCFSSSDSEGTTSEEETLKDTSSITSMCPSKSVTTTGASNNIATQTSMICPAKNLKKTPAVYLDVEVGSDDSVLITAPVEIKDRHTECNRQFSSVIRVSPRKTMKQRQEIQSGNNETQVTSTTSSITTDYRENVQNAGKQMDQDTNRKDVIKEKRFTVISDLVKKQQEQTKSTKGISPTKRQNTETNFQTSPKKFVALSSSSVPTSRPPVSRPPSQPMSPPKASISSKSPKVMNGGHTQPPSNSAASANTVALGSTSSSSCRVQFYDYNSKLTKERGQSQANVMVNRQRDSVLPTAMEQATMENRLQYDKQQDMMNKNKQIEERGQKALEREQIRRDCNELTEKLEALTRQYPRQVATNENPHIFVDKQLRMEGKMNSAVEKLLSRPNVITCSELEQRDTNAERKTKPTIGVSNGCNEINVGAETNNMMNADDATSDSCCSILLGYVDDQSRQVRKDLEQWSSDREQNGEKQQRLKNLLKRLDELRMSLIQELKNDEKGKAGERVKVSSNKEGKYQQLIEDISTYRKERENILSDEVHQKQNIKSKDQISAKELRDRKIEKFNSKVSSKHPLDEREKILQQKEAILDEKLREFYELQKQNKTKKISKRKENVSETRTEIQQETEYSDNKENIDCSTIQTPVEIVITVQGETKCIKIPGSSKRKPMQKRSHTQLATHIRSPQTKAKITKATPKKKLPIPRDKESPAKSQIPTQGKGNQVNKPMLGRHNSYDSNSTSYMSLPPQMPTQLGVLVDKQQQHEETIHKSTSSEDTQVSTDLDNDESQEHQIKKPVPHLNPLVAQYVQRLLGMSRKAIKRLGVSSSDIDTPNSTIINTSGNHSTSESILSDERLAFVESFVQENRSFIKELEKSIRTQNNESLENSMRAFDEIWRKQLKKQQKSSVEKPKEKFKKQQTKVKKSQETNAILSKDIAPNTETKELQSKEVTSQPKLSSESEKPSTSKLTTRTTLSAKCKKAQDKHKEPQCGQEEITNVKSCQNTLGQRRSSEKVDKAVETKMSQDLNKSESDSQIARYAQLTENCTHRIAELTELINRVREEKQRLLEVTLSSVSDNGRQSTEYLDLPEGKSRTTNEGESSLASSTEETTAAPHKSTSSLDIGRQIPKLSALEKNRSIAASQDSGIAESRPMTALEHRQDLEPISQTTTESHSIVQGHRKMKPPPSLRRFSPQFQEDELVHELSTILEVDTPANSRLNTAVSQKSEDPTAAVTPPQNPIMFPTFEEYVQRLNLDISQMDKEQSSQLHAEFSLFIEDMQRSRTKEQGDHSPQYNEFPSISGYMANQTKPDLVDQTETMLESLAQLRLDGLQPKSFPAVREYLKRNSRNNDTTISPSDDQQMLLDTESLENITESESASLDIEKELKERKILKNSFRYTKSKQIFSSTAHHDGGGGEFYHEVLAGESGIEKLSTSGNTTAILETDLKRMVRQWSKDGNKNNQPPQYQSLSSTTTSTTYQAKALGGKSTSLDETSNENGRPLNLRDFLTRELKKHANISTSTSTSSSDDSLRSQFLYSLIGSLTPRTNAATSKSGQHTLDRQKTSTPVPMQSSQTHSTPTSGKHPSQTSSSQLFSGESRLSSVHGYDGSTAGGNNNAD